MDSVEEADWIDVAKEEVKAEASLVVARPVTSAPSPASATDGAGNR